MSGPKPESIEDWRKRKAASIAPQAAQSFEEWKASKAPAIPSMVGAGRAGSIPNPDSSIPPNAGNIFDRIIAKIESNSIKTQEAMGDTDSALLSPTNLAQGVESVGSSVFKAPLRLAAAATDVITDPIGSAKAGIEGIRGAYTGIAETLTDPTRSATEKVLGNILYDSFVHPVIFSTVESLLGTTIARRDASQGDPTSVPGFYSGKSLTPQERNNAAKEGVANVGGLLIGLEFAKAFTKAGSAVASVEAVAGARDMKEVFSSLHRLPAPALMEISDRLSSVGWQSSFAKGIQEGIVGGAAVGFLSGETKEERFQAAFGYGIVGALLGGVFEVGGAGIRNVRGKSFIEIGETAKWFATNEQARVVASLPPKNAARAAAMVHDGIAIDEAIYRNMDADEVVLLRGVATPSDFILDKARKNKIPSDVVTTSEEAFTEASTKITRQRIVQHTKDRWNSLSVDEQQAMIRRVRPGVPISGLEIEQARIVVTANIDNFNPNANALGNIIHSVFFKELDVDAMQKAVTTDDVRAYWQNITPEAFTEARKGNPIEIRKNSNGTHDIIFQPKNVAEADISYDPIMRGKYAYGVTNKGYGDFAAKIHTHQAMRLAQKLLGTKLFSELVGAELAIQASIKQDELRPSEAMGIVEFTARGIVDHAVKGEPLEDPRSFFTVRGVDLPGDFSRKLSEYFAGTPKDEIRQLQATDALTVVNPEDFDAIHTYLYGKAWKDKARDYWDVLKVSDHPEDKAFIMEIIDRLNIANNPDDIVDLLSLDGNALDDNLLGIISAELANKKDIAISESGDPNISFTGGVHPNYIVDRVMKMIVEDSKGNKVGSVTSLDLPTGDFGVKIYGERAELDQLGGTMAEALDMEYGINEFILDKGFLTPGEGVKTSLGLPDYLEIPRLDVVSPKAIEHWRKTGFFPDQAVELKGRGYRVVQVAANISKENLDKMVEKAKAELAKNPNDVNIQANLDEALEIAEKHGEILKGNEPNNILLQDVLTGKYLATKASKVGVPNTLAFIVDRGSQVYQTDVFGRVVDVHIKSLMDIKDTAGKPSYPLFTPEEAAIIDKNSTKYMAEREAVVEELGRRYTSVDAILEPLDGKVQVSDRKTGKVIAIVDNLDDLQAMAPDKNGIFIAGGGKGGGGGGTTILPPSFDDRFGASKLGEPGGNNASANFVDRLRLAPFLNQIIPFQFLAKAVENLMPNVKMHTEIFRPFQAMLYKFNANRAPYLMRVAEISKKLFKGIDQIRRTVIFDYIGTMSADEVALRRLSRPMTDREISFGDSIYELLKDKKNGDLSLKRVSNYQLERARLRDADLKPKQRNRILDDFNNSQKDGPLDANELYLLRMLDTNKHNSAYWHHYVIKDYISAKLTDRLSRKDFIVANKMAPEEIGAALAVEGLFKELGTVFGIKDTEKITNYISHLKRYGDAVNIKISDIFPELNKVERDFFASQPRVGNITDINKDPIDVLLRYVNAGFRDQSGYGELRSKLDARVAVMEQEIARIPNIKNPQQTAVAIRRMADEFIAEASGRVTDVEAIAEAAHLSYLEHLGVADETERFKFLDNFTSTFNPFSYKNLNKNIEFAAQGFKPLAGIRDATSFAQVFTMRFGLDYLRWGIRDFNRIWTNSGALVASGKTPGLAQNFAESSFEQMAREAVESSLGSVHIAAKVFDQLRDAGFNLSLQPTMYEKAHAFTYTIVKGKTLEAIRDLTRGKIKNRAEFDNAIRLDAFAPSVIREFNRLLGDGIEGADKASDYLAVEAGYEVVGHYGKANSPKLMWSKPGRVLGQFAQWPAWYLNVAADLLTRGSATTRARHAGYIAASMAGFAYVQQQTGFNLQSWSMDPRNSLNYKGSPSWNVLHSLVSLASSDQESERNFAERTLRNLFDPVSGIMLPVPLMMRHNMLELMGRVEQEDPAHIIGWKLLGGAIDKEQYDKPDMGNPASDFYNSSLDSMKESYEGLKESYEESSVDKKQAEGMAFSDVIPGSSSLAKATSPRLSPEFIRSSNIDLVKYAELGVAVAALSVHPKFRMGLELEFHIKLPKGGERLRELEKFGTGVGRLSRADMYLKNIHTANILRKFNEIFDHSIANPSKDKNGRYILKHEISGLELNYGIFDLEKLDIEQLKRRLNWLAQHTSDNQQAMAGGTFSNKYSGLAAMHIHVSPTPAVKTANHAFDFSDRPTVLGIDPLYPLPRTSHAGVLEGSGTGVRLSVDKGTIEYRGMETTFDVNVIMERLTKALKYTKELVDKYGIKASELTENQMREASGVLALPKYAEAMSSIRASLGDHPTTKQLDRAFDKANNIYDTVLGVSLRSTDSHSNELVKSIREDLRVISQYRERMKKMIVQNLR